MKKILVISALFLSFIKIHSQTDPKATEVWTPVPKIVTPGNATNTAPSDAIILFDGKDLSNWTSNKGGPARWNVNDGAMTVDPGTDDIITKQGFGSCQLHIEWQTPLPAKGDGQDRGNSGVYLMNRYELQVLDSYDNLTYPNGQAGSIYKQFIPLVNVCRPPGEWQTYDIIFTAPVFRADSSLQYPAKFTVFQNGVLIQNNVELKGSTVYIGQPSYKMHREKEPLLLQNHGNMVSYRNIWIREL